MSEKSIRLIFNFKNKDAKFWKALRNTIGASSDVAVLYFILKQYQLFISDTIELIDMKKVREMYDTYKNDE